MSTVEIRRSPGGPWELLHDVYPGIVDDVGPCIGGPPDERLFLVWGMRQGSLQLVPTIDPTCPIAFRLSGQFRDGAGWQITPMGLARLAVMFRMAAAAGAAAAAMDDDPRAS